MRISRPGLRTAAALGGVAALIAISGCTSSGSSSSDGNGQGAPASLNLVEVTDPATTDVPSVTWNLPYEPASLDPIKSQVFADAPVESNMCESLLKVEPDLSVGPGLAESFSQTGATSWTYKLRPGVTFWDGSPMTAKDVVASLKRNIDPNAGSYWSLEYQNVKSIEATGPDEVTVTTSKPDVLINMTMSTSGGAISKASALAAAGADYGNSKTGLMCTGPFKFTSWQPGNSITLTRNDNYWNKAEMPKVGQLTYKFVSDANTISSSLISGELDGMYEVPAAAIPQLQNATNGKLYLGPSTASLDLIPTERQGPMRDPKIRQALYWALDRSAVATGVYYGAATPALSFVNPGVGYGKTQYQQYFDSRPPAKVDLDKAKQLVTEAGNPTTPIQIATSPDPSLVTVANAIAAAGQSIGLDVKVVTLTPAEADQLYFDPKLRETYDGFLNVQWTPVTEPLEELAFVTKGAFTNYGLYDNPTFEKAYSDALGVVDPDARADAVIKALTILDNDLPWVPIVSLPVPTFLSSKLTGIPTSWAFLYGQWAQGLGGK